jgi:hypothetical protein
VAHDEDEHLDEDDEPTTRRHPYTWLHLLVLSLVAFVLGFLAMLLYIQASGNDEPAAGAAVRVVDGVVAHDGSGPL